MYQYLKILLVFLLSSTPLLAIDGFIIAGSVGGVYYQRKELYEQKYNYDAYNYGTNSIWGAPTYKLTAGYEFYNMGFTVNLLRTTINYSVDEFSTNAKVREKNATTALYGQIYYKFTLHSDFSPFIGGGYGLYAFRNKLQNVQGQDIKINRNKYMYSILAGLLYNFTDQLALGFTYETYYIPKFSYESSQDKDGNTAFYTRNKYLAHNLYFTLKYYFY